MYNNIMISAMDSHSGKTAICSSLIAALKKRGINVAAFKTGPDYIDPMYHTIAAERVCINLEPYFLEPDIKKDELKKQFAHYSKGADIAVTEAAMGYFSGIYKEEPRASAYSVAKELDSYVIMVVSKDNYMKLSEYLAEYNDEFVKAVIVNKVNKEEYTDIKNYLEKHTGFTILGHLDENEAFMVESRHLGLYTPDDVTETVKILEKRSKILETTVDIDLLLSETDKSGRDKFENLSYNEAEYENSFRLAVAKDEAFLFIYEDNLELLKSLGAKIVFFSPLHDEKLPENISGLWIPGGYPERYGKELSENSSMCESIKNAIDKGVPTIAECGGYMYLHEEMKDKEENIYKLVGVIKGLTFPTGKLQRFGYIEVSACEDNMLLKVKESFRAHEFHYWDSENNGRSCHAVKANKSKEWDCIHAKDNLFAGYPHIYLRTNVNMAKRFVDKCVMYKESQI